MSGGAAGCKVSRSVLWWAGIVWCVPHARLGRMLSNKVQLSLLTGEHCALLALPAVQCWASAPTGRAAPKTPRSTWSSVSARPMPVWHVW